MISTLIAQLLGASVTEADVLEAYSLDHPDFLSRPIPGSPDPKTLIINGDFFTRDEACKNAGYFKRSIYKTGNATVVKHDAIFVQEDCRRRGIAKAHLKKILRFYDAVGVEYVHMDAVDWGPVVWPQFGFNFQEPKAIGPLHEIFEALYVAETGQKPSALPERLPPFALTLSPSGRPLGAEAIREFSIRAGNRPITLLLDLRDETTRTFLAVRGIL